MELVSHSQKSVDSTSLTMREKNINLYYYFNRNKKYFN